MSKPRTPEEQENVERALAFLRGDPSFSAARLKETSQAVKGLPKSRQKAQAEEDLGFAYDAKQRGLRAIGKLGATGAEIKEGLKAAAEHPVGRTVIGGAATVGHLFDTPDRLVTRPAGAALLGLPPESAASSTEFHQAAEKAALEGNDRARLFQSIKSPLGGALAGAATSRSLGGALAGAALGGIAEIPQLEKAFPQGTRAAKDFFADAGFSLWNLAGVTGPKKAADAWIGRLKGLNPKAADAAKNLLKSEFGPQTFDKLKKTLVNGGAKEEAITRALGKRGENLGRGEFRFAGVAPAEATERLAQLFGKPGGGEFLGEKAINAAMSPLQKVRGFARDKGVNVPLPFVSHQAPLFGETFNQERFRQRLMDAAERKARTVTAAKTEEELARAAKKAPTVQKISDEAKRKRLADTLVKNAFLAGNKAGGAGFEAELRQIFKTRPKDALPKQGQEFLNVMRPGAERDVGQLEPLFRTNEILNKAWQTKNLIANPAFTLRNVSEDAGKLFAEGVSPLDVWKARKSFKAAEAGDQAAQKALADITSQGVDLGHSNRHDFSRLEGKHEAERKMAKLFGTTPLTDNRAIAALDTGASFVGDQFEKLPAWTLMNRKAMNAWEGYAKKALYDRQIKNGLPPALAAERTSQILLDYGRKFGANDRFFKNIFSFVPYKTQAPLAAGKLLASAPGRVNVLKSAFDAAQPYKTGTEAQAPDWQSKRGYTIRAPEFLTEARRAVVQDPKAAIQDASYFTAPIAPLNEISQPFELAEALGTGSPKEIGKSFILDNLAPNIQDVAEPILGMRFLTGEKIKEKNEGKELFSRLLGRASPHQGFDKFIEWAANKVNEPAVPDRFIGRYDKESLDAYNDLPLWLMQQITPGKVTDPSFTQWIKNAQGTHSRKSLDSLTQVEQQDTKTRKIKKDHPR